MTSSHFTIIAFCAIAVLAVIIYIAVPVIQDTLLFDPAPLQPHALVGGGLMEFTPTKDGEAIAYVMLPPTDGNGHVGGMGPTDVANYTSPESGVQATAKASMGTSTSMRSKTVALSVYFHGRRGNILTALHQARMDADAGMWVMLFDYRGYGASSGTPTEQGMYLDAQAALDVACNRLEINHDQVVLHGYSMGCALAVYLAQKHDDFAALVLESPFQSLSTATMHIYPYLLPMKHFLTGMFDNIQGIAKVRHTPLYITHSSTDECIAFTDAAAIYESALCTDKHLQVSPLDTHAGPHLTASAYKWIRHRIDANRVRVRPDTE